MTASHLMIDCASLAYRAYFSMPPVQAPDGTPVNAIVGFLGFVSRLLHDRRPALLHIALDADWRPQFRVDALPTYKTQRVLGPGDPPDPVEPQIALLETVLEAAGLSLASAEGFEAEDVIATLTARATLPVEVVTGDRDLFALVADPNVVVLYTKRGVSDLARVDAAYIAEKYGIPGDRYLDYAILRGDPSDGLPGVRGIGEKTASALLRQYGSLEAILAAPDLDALTRSRLTRSAGYLAAARRVVGMVRDAPVAGGDGTIPSAPPDVPALRALAVRYGITNSIDRLLTSLAAR